MQGKKIEVEQPVFEKASTAKWAESDEAAIEVLKQALHDYASKAVKAESIAVTGAVKKQALHEQAAEAMRAENKAAEAAVRRSGRCRRGRRWRPLKQGDGRRGNVAWGPRGGGSGKKC